jgi:hypothetical protein
MAHFSGNFLRQRAHIKVSKDKEIIKVVSQELIQLVSARLCPKESMCAYRPQNFHAVSGVNGISCMDTEASSVIRLDAGIRGESRGRDAAYAG